MNAGLLVVDLGLQLSRRGEAGGVTSPASEVPLMLGSGYVIEQEDVQLLGHQVEVVQLPVPVSGLLTGGYLVDGDEKLPR